MTRSIWPTERSTAKSQTPKLDPMRPPISSIAPILKSTLPLFQCARTPETEEATIWFASVPTATGAGTPMKIRIGVMRNPPPTPKIPERKPITPPKASRRKASTDISAMGR